MITYKQGDLLSVKEGIIAHGCNAQGVMGAGVAKQVRSLYPKAYDEYAKMPKTLGSVGYVQVTDTLVIANCITQQNYGSDKNVRYVDYRAIELVFRQLGMLMEGNIHIPKIGAGLANGDWSIISALIEKNAPKSNITVWH